MPSKDVIAIFPSRANHVFMKQRILSALRGLSLLKRKRDALEIKLREIDAELKKTLVIIDNIMQEAIFSMAKANYLSTDLKPATVLAPTKADVYINIKNTKVVGLTVPTFELVSNAASSLPLTGLSRGGAQVEVIRKKYQDAITALVALASLEYAVKTLKEAVRQNNMRVNGLDYVVIPRFKNTIDYIAEELDEYEREDFYRLKRSQAKQRQAKVAFAALIVQKNRERELENEMRIIKRDIDLPGTMMETFDIDDFEKAVRANESSNSVQQETSRAEPDVAVSGQEETDRPEAQVQNNDQAETEPAERQVENEDEQN